MDKNNPDIFYKSNHSNKESQPERAKNCLRCGRALSKFEVLLCHDCEEGV